MNFIGHIHTANVGAFDPHLLLGTALPDLVGIGGFRLIDGANSANPALSEGIQIHFQTDDLFHSHRSFVAGSEKISSRLEQAGLGRGPALACGHVGYELLLDGVLLRQNPQLGELVREVITTLGDPSAGLDDLVGADKKQPWSEFRQRFVERFDELPGRYDQPASVSAQLYRILAGRKRLRFDQQQGETVSAVLSEFHPLIASDAAKIVQDLRRDLAIDG